jgi:hypothetical protein
MEKYQLVVLVNQLKEDHLQNLSGKESLSMGGLASLIDPLDAKRSFLIATQATLKNVINQLEDFIHLSYLKQISVEVIYCSAYEKLTNKFAGDDVAYLHFYDRCVKSKVMEQFAAQFMQGSEMKWINTNRHVLPKLVVRKETEFKTEQKLINERESCLIFYSGGIQLRRTA